MKIIAQVMAAACIGVAVIRVFVGGHPAITLGLLVAGFLWVWIWVTWH